MPADPARPEAAGPASAPAPAPARHNGNISLALDFGPLLVFFITYKVAGVIAGTGAFMAAIIAAVAISKIKLGKVSPMLWLSAILVLFFGSLTIYFHSPKFIQIKPTIIYAFFALLLAAGLMRGKSLMKVLLEAAYDGLSDEGWRKLSRNWAWFFAAMALINEGLRASVSFDTWLTIKVWGVTAASFLFALANIPMAMRHGLNVGGQEVSEAVGQGDPPQG